MSKCGPCRRCMFWERVEVIGFCRRHAPRIQMDGRNDWPTTVSGDWCGEFEEHHGDDTYQRDFANGGTK